MRAFLIITGAALALAGCGGNKDSDDVNTLAVDNLVVDDGMSNEMMTGDMNGTMGVDANGMMTSDMNNMSADDTANAMQQDMTHNDADTNLANGM
jgi:hypothetical protein